jgi:hypothetical protein
LFCDESVIELLLGSGSDLSEDSGEVDARTGHTVSGIEVLLQADEIVGPTCRGKGEDIVSVLEAPVRESVRSRTFRYKWWFDQLHGR